MAVIAIDVPQLQATIGSLGQRLEDVNHGESLVRRCTEQLVLHRDDPSVAGVPDRLQSARHRLIGVNGKIGDQRATMDRFLGGAVALDARQGLRGPRVAGRAWWRRLRRSSAAAHRRSLQAFTIGVQTGVHFTSGVTRAGSRFAGAAFHSGVSLLRRSGRFVHQQGENFVHSVRTGWADYVVRPFQQLRTWAAGTWKKVTGWLRDQWEIAQHALSMLLHSISVVVQTVVLIVAVLPVAGYLFRKRILQFAADAPWMVLDRLFPPPSLDPTQQGGQKLLAEVTDSFSENATISTNQIGIKEVTPNRFIVILPGVEDLSEGTDLLKQKGPRAMFDKWFAAQPSGSPRDMSVALKAFLSDQNNYADVVKSLIRNGKPPIPPGAELLIVGHSHGSYTAFDVAADPEFNNQSGVAGTFRVTHVLGLASASDVEAVKLPPSTQKFIINNRADLPNAVEEIATAPRRGSDTASNVHSHNFWGVARPAGAGHDPRDYAEEIRRTPSNQALRDFYGEVGAMYGNSGHEGVIARELSSTGD